VGVLEADVANPRRSDAEKKLTGTFRPERSEAMLFHGRTRLETELSPPSDLDADAKREWKTDMHLCVGAGTINATNMRSFVSMVQAAAAAQKAYARCMREGPTTKSADGTLKGSVSDRAIEVGRVKRHYR
jgi:hypothetical protein